MSEYLTIKETAELLKVTRRTVQRWIKDEKLPSIKIGGTVRILKTDIPTYARQN